MLNSVCEIQWELVRALNFLVLRGLKVGAGSAASCTTRGGALLL